MNDILKRIKKEIVDPEMNKIKNSVIGYVTAVHVEEQTADLVLLERDGTRRRQNHIPFPKIGGGLMSQSLEPGDRVEVGYRNNQYQNAYIIQVYRDSSKERTLSYGQQLPRSTDLF